MSKTKIRIVMAVFTALMVISVFAGFAIGTVNASGPTYVSGPITTNTTWYFSESPYIVTGDITLFPGYTLTIEPGVTVLFNPGTALTIRGNLNASGTHLQRIVFTSTDGTWKGVHVATDLGGKATVKFANFSYAETAISVACCGSDGPAEIYDTMFVSNNVALGGYAGWTLIVET